MIKYIFDLIYPNVCFSCGNHVSKKLENICINCRYNLPISDSIHTKDNPLEKVFWGRVEIEDAAYFLRFEQNNIAQKLIHQLKYKGQKKIGVTLGNICASKWSESKFFENIDLIIPVPIHKKKERIRGYNQSEYFAMGLAEPLGIDFDFEIISKEINTQSQTRKSRWQRWENVNSTFKLNKPIRIKDKNILLVDDVVTTGSTLESCAKVLQEEGINTLKVLTLAATL